MIRAEVLLPLGLVEARCVELAFSGLLPKARNSNRCQYIGVHRIVHLESKDWKAVLGVSQWTSNVNTLHNRTSTARPSSGAVVSTSLFATVALFRVPSPA